MRTKFIPCKCFLSDLHAHGFNAMGAMCSHRQSPQNHNRRKIANTFASLFFQLVLISVAAGGLAACNEFVEQDTANDSPRRPRLAESTETKPATTAATMRSANQLSPTDQRRADLAISIIKESDDREKIEAAMIEIGRLNDPRGPAALLTMLRAGRVSTIDQKHLALFSQTLAGFRSEDATRELVAIVRAGKKEIPNESDFVFDAAVAVLSQMRDPRTVPMLIDVMVGNKLTTSSAAAIEILAAIGTEPAIKAMAETITHAQYTRKWFEAICEGLRKMGDDAAPAIIELWQFSRDWVERGMVLHALMGKQKPEVLAIAKQACKFEDAETRKEGVSLASTLDGKEAWDLVIAAIPDPSEKVRSSVVSALTLGRGSSGRAGEALGHLAKFAKTDAESGIREFALRGLEYNLQTSPRFVVETFVVVLKSDKASHVRSQAASCLDLGDQMIPGKGSAIEIANVLVAALADEDEFAAYSAARSLLSFGERERVKAFAEKALAAAKLAKADEYRIDRLKDLLAESKLPQGKPSPVRIVDAKGELLKGS